MKTRMITRTIKTTEVKALMLDIGSETTMDCAYTLPGTYNNNVDILNAIQESVGPEYKACVVKSTTVKETLYGMPETDFIKNASPIIKNN